MKLFVWDFHGVLEKDNEKAVIDISNRVLEKENYKERFTDEDNDRYYGLRWYQYFENLLPNVSIDECLRLQAECLKNQSENESIIRSIIKPSDYAILVVQKIKDSGHEQIVISNTRPDDIVWFLESVNLKEFFNDNQIFGVNTHQTKGSKIESLNKYLSEKEFEKIISIGDSEGDLELGKAFNGTTYYYRHPNRKHEETSNADYLIHDLREVLKELK